MPFFAGPPLRLPDGRLLIDGGVAAGRVPLEQAIEAGCTHILAVVTDRNMRPEEQVRSSLEKFAAAILCRQFPELRSQYWEGHEIHRRTIEKLRCAEFGELQEPKIQVVRIADELIPDRTGTDPAKLYAAAQAMEQVTLELFKPYELKRDGSVTTRPPRSRKVYT
jgi:predicted patatin/cPLA2 family phospholipase